MRYLFYVAKIDLPCGRESNARKLVHLYSLANPVAKSHRVIRLLFI